MRDYTWYGHRLRGRQEISIARAQCNYHILLVLAFCVSGVVTVVVVLITIVVLL